MSEINNMLTVVHTSKKENYFDDSYKVNNIHEFLSTFNIYYNGFVDVINSSEKDLEEKSIILEKNLGNILLLIYNNLDCINLLPRENVYLILNCLKLARNMGLDIALELFKTQEIQKLDEIYVNSRKKY